MSKPTTTTTTNGRTSKGKGNVMSSEKGQKQDAATNAAFAEMRRKARQEKLDAIHSFTGAQDVATSARRILDGSDDRAAIVNPVNSREDYSAAGDFAALLRAGGEEFAAKLMSEYTERPTYLSAELWSRWQSQYRRLLMSGLVTIQGNVVSIADLPIRNGKYYYELPMTVSLYCRIVTKGDMLRALEFGDAFGTQDGAMKALGAAGERMPHVVTVYRFASLIRKTHAAIVKARNKVLADDSDVRTAKRLASLETDLLTYESGFTVAWIRATAASAAYTAAALVARHTETMAALEGEILACRNEDAARALREALVKVSAERDAAMASYDAAMVPTTQKDAAVLASAPEVLAEVKAAVDQAPVVAEEVAA